MESNDARFQVAAEELSRAARERGVDIQADQVSHASLGHQGYVDCARWQPYLRRREEPVRLEHGPRWENHAVQPA